MPTGASRPYASFAPADIAVNLYPPGGFVLGDPLVRRRTDNEGRYEFRVPPGNYAVKFLVKHANRAWDDPLPGHPPSVAATLQNVGNDDSVDSDAEWGDIVRLVVTSGADTRGVDIGYRSRLNVVEGHSWYDVNRNGLREAGEPA